MYFTTLPSPVGTLTLASDGTALTGLWLENQKYFAAGLSVEAEKAPDLPIFQQTADWLSGYFSGQIPVNLPLLTPIGSPFRQAVWNCLLVIPYGETRTYGELAAALGSSPRAVGGAVGHNPISILIPCHRVMGAGGRLTGYAGGVDKKAFLLELEKKNLSGRKKHMFLPEASSGEGLTPERESPPPAPGKFPCPCCGYHTFPVPKEEAVAYICPVCFWENDVFDPGEDQPSDENRGMPLRQGREAYRRLGAVREEFLCHVREPFPEERGNS